METALNHCDDRGHQGRGGNPEGNARTAVSAARSQGLGRFRVEAQTPTGNLAGWKIDVARYNKMLDEYYDLHGWDKETSFPTRNALEVLGLEGVAADLENIGKLGSDHK